MSPRVNWSMDDIPTMPADLFDPILRIICKLLDKHTPWMSASMLTVATIPEPVEGKNGMIITGLCLQKEGRISGNNLRL
jgi:hypothetical protein